MSQSTGYSHEEMPDLEAWMPKIYPDAYSGAKLPPNRFKVATIPGSKLPPFR
jgi:hypothetical protein